LPRPYPNAAAGTRVLFVINDDAYRKRHWQHRLDHLARNGYDVVVAIPGDAGDHTEAGGIRFVRYFLRRTSRHPFKELKALWGLYRRIREVRPDIIHSATMKPNLYAGLINRLFFRRKQIVSVTGLGALFIHRDPSSRLLRAFVLSLFRAIGTSAQVRFAFENAQDQGVFERREIGAPGRRILTKGAGVDPAAFHPDAKIETIGAVGLAGRMIADKGVREFVEASRASKAEGLDLRFVLAGMIDEDHRYGIRASTIRAWAEAGVIEWWGHVEAMNRFYNQMDIVCLPSYREGLPKAILEAMACGRPVIAADTPGCSDLVENGVNGLLVEPCNASDLKEKIAYLASRPRLRAEMGRNNLEASRKYSLDVVLDETLSLYASVTGSRSSGRVREDGQP